jgi:hypothetical protein
MVCLQHLFTHFLSLKFFHTLKLLILITCEIYCKRGSLIGKILLFMLLEIVYKNVSGLSKGDFFLL